MSAQLSSFYPLIAPEVPGCPLILMREQILNAAIDFCERSQVWIAVQAPISVTANLADYTFTAPAGAVVHSIRSATFDGQPIDPLTREWCDVYLPGWRPGVSPVVTGIPVGITQMDPTGYRLVYTPVANGTLIIEVSYKPDRNPAVTTLPDILFDEYKETVCCGALARLLIMADVPWRNPETAAVHAARFKEGYEGANLRQTKGFGRASLRVQGQFL